MLKMQHQAPLLRTRLKKLFQEMISYTIVAALLQGKEIQR